MFAGCSQEIFSSEFVKIWRLDFLGFDFAKQIYFCHRLTPLPKSPTTDLPISSSPSPEAVASPLPAVEPRRSRSMTTTGSIDSSSTGSPCPTAVSEPMVQKIKTSNRKQKKQTSEIVVNDKKVEEVEKTIPVIKLCE